MTDSGWCGKCGQYMLYPESHSCPPSWDVLELGYDNETWEDATIAYGRDAADAAAKWAEKEDQDSAEYSIVHGTPATVAIKRQGAPPAAAVIIIASGEHEPTYTGELARSVRCPGRDCTGKDPMPIDDDHRPGQKCEYCGKHRYDADTASAFTTEEEQQP